ncbi:jg9865 [Pararge aegeria aegeria]|uniref:Jg9865 protein n=1 Tax=Pararge aegeria aegeria TaxID=348720 RepID=A0A8S4RJ88_9NEOP|nr:jg9865 [Pararge aegeria aegeria]
MGQELNQVLASTNDVFDAVLNSNASKINEFIIVTFNDPFGNIKIKPAILRIKTNNRDDFITTLNEIKIKGGYDCPEMAMTGIELALQESKPNSLVYVFTDASAKDYMKYESVKTLAQQKSIQVTFLLTGKCEKEKEELYIVYHRLATVTSGQVFNIGKQEISKIIEYIVLTIRSKRNTLLQKTYKDYECKNKYTFTVDSKLWDILIAKSAQRDVPLYDLAIFGPGGKVEVKDLIQTKNTSIVKIKVETGDYSVYIKDCRDVTIVVSASTSVSFQHGFSSFKPNSLDKTSRKPIANSKSYLAIALENKERDVTLKTVILRDINDIFVKELSLKLIDEHQQFYITDSFTPPNVTFKLVVSGFTDLKENITRVSSTAIDYYEIKEVPEIDKLKSVYTKDRESSVDILCRVIRGNPEPVISWSFDQDFLGKFIKLKETGEAVHIDHVRLEHVGTYKCNVANEIGNDHHTMQLFIEYPPTVEIRPKDNHNSKKGKEIKLECLVSGSPAPDVRWFREHVEIESGGRYTIYRDHTLSFTGEISDSGSYACEASNSLDTTRGSVTVFIYEPAKIEIPEESVFKAELLGNLSLPCNVSGHPVPRVQWLYYPFRNNKRIPTKLSCDESNKLTLEYIQLEDEGYYACTADNNVHQDILTYTVTVPVPAYIIFNFGSINIHVVEGDLLFKLRCLVLGSPTPTLNWTVNGFTITGNGRYEILNDGTLIVNNVSLKSKGTYTCLAKNVHGNDTMEYEVDVHPYPPIQENPVKILLSEGEKRYTMHCGMMSRPSDLLRWFKDGKFIKTAEHLILVNVAKNDSGYYTCRCSTSERSYSFHKIILVGKEPKFLTEVNSTLTYKEGAEAILDCSASGEPPPITKWWRDYVEVPNINTSQYSFIMNNNNIGQIIMCSVSNEFNIKEIKRYFNFTAGECLMKLEDDFTARQPILVTGVNKRQWPIFPTSNGTLRMQKLRKFSLLCPESNIIYNGRKHDSNILKTSCVDDSMFELEGRAVPASKISCTKPIKPLAKALHSSKCLGHNTVRLYIGFDFEGSFLTVFNVCFDNVTKTPLYVEYGMHKAIANTIPNHVNGYTKGRYLRLGFDYIYECRNQMGAISSFTGKTLKSDKKCCFGRRQLVNPRDVLPGISQVATYHYMNVVPQWSTCGTENWDEVERRVRMFAINLNYTIPIWTGATSERPNVAPIYLKDIFKRRLQVPQYIWKVVYKQLAIIHINVPGLTSLQVSSYILCKDICDQIDWMKSDQWQNIDKGFIYCCNIKEFQRVFRYYGIFD